MGLCAVVLQSKLPELVEGDKGGRCVVVLQSKIAELVEGIEVEPLIASQERRRPKS